MSKFGINILTIIPQMEDATSLYRATGPFATMRKQIQCNPVFTSSIGENQMEFADVVFMQRPFTPEHVKIADMCADSGTPLWIDYDDLLFDLPPDNPAHHTYMNQEARSRLVKIINKASIVTVTTQQLKKCLQDPVLLNNNVHVIPNAFPDKFLSLMKPYNHKKQVNWRGTNTHMRDIGDYATPLIELAQTRKDTSFVFVGYNPWFVTEQMDPKQSIVVPPMTNGDYFRFMSATNPSVQIVPLSDNLFNRCKSNIAFLEANMAGAVAIVPQWNGWNLPGCLTYRNQAEFKHYIEQALDEPGLMEHIHKSGREYIMENMLLTKVNSKRCQILESLVGKAQMPEGGQK